MIALIPHIVRGPDITRIESQGRGGRQRDADQGRLCCPRKAAPDDRPQRSTRACAGVAAAPAGHRTGACATAAAAPPADAPPATAPPATAPPATAPPARRRRTGPHQLPSADSGDAAQFHDHRDV